MAADSSNFAWRIPGTEDPGRLNTVHGVTKSQGQLSNQQIFPSASTGKQSLILSISPQPLPTVMLDHPLEEKA